MDLITITLTVDRYQLATLIEDLSDCPELSDLRLQLILAYAAHHNRRVDALADTMPPDEAQKIRDDLKIKEPS